MEDAAACAALSDARIRVVLGSVLAQRYSMETALNYAKALSPGVRVNSRALSEAAGHEGGAGCKRCSGRLCGTGRTCRLIARARLAFARRWSSRRRRHQATAR
jgi:hypothetical protein